MSNEESKDQIENGESIVENKTEDQVPDVKPAEELSPEDKIKELNDKYLRLYSEFENFRRRTAKERLDLMKNAGEDIMSDLLPVLDDLERALNAINENSTYKTTREGISLVLNKFTGALIGRGLKAFESKGKVFDPEFHEAVTKVPAPSKKLRGKVVDEIEKGYMLNDKVIRYAKVVVGE